MSACHARFRGFRNRQPLAEVGSNRPDFRGFGLRAEVSMFTDGRCRTWRRSRFRSDRSIAMANYTWIHSLVRFAPHPAQLSPRSVRPKRWKLGFWNTIKSYQYYFLLFSTSYRCKKSSTRELEYHLPVYYVQLLTWSSLKQKF
uniref:PH01B001I13.2 protein n=1 Tax=Phyllostachys edulis TaxID=38705 RepID=L0P1K7_PHYED|nr:PH01B001I13.2 [Phyllostachys edulis]